MVRRFEPGSLIVQTGGMDMFRNAVDPPSVHGSAAIGCVAVRAGDV